MSEEKIKEKYKAMQKVFRNHNFAQQDTEEKIKFTRIWDPLKTKCHEWLARREKKKLEGFLVPLEELVAERSCYRTFADHVKNILLNKFGIKTISKGKQYNNSTFDKKKSELWTYRDKLIAELIDEMYFEEKETSGSYGTIMLDTSEGKTAMAKFKGGISAKVEEMLQSGEEEDDDDEGKLQQSDEEDGDNYKDTFFPAKTKV